MSLPLVISISPPRSLCLHQPSNAQAPQPGTALLPHPLEGGEIRVMKSLNIRRVKIAIAVPILIAGIVTVIPPTYLAVANRIETYGQDGRDGQHGRNGQDGRDGRVQSVRVGGPPQQINAMGEPGFDGEDGRPGERPSCPRQPRSVRYDLKAPGGGDGGNGGNGGRGGRGGDVTLYYNDSTQLRQIRVNAEGGRAGRGGRGGRGGDGCRCDNRSWTIRTCPECAEERYVCRDGEVGRYGRDGQNGRPGEFGSLWLINQLDPLAVDQPSVTLPLDLLMRQPVNLSKNIWETRRGANSLLAPGSQVNDTYFQYRGRLEAQAQVAWEAPRSQTAFMALSPTIALTDSGNLQLDFPSGYWVAGRTEQAGTLTTYTIEAIVREEDAKRLSWGTQSGRGADFQVAVIDLGGESDYVNTQFELTYRTTDDDPRSNRRARYREQFSGPLPSDLVVREQNRFVLQLGRLPISPRYFQPGTNARIELRIKRSLGTNSAEQTLEWQGRL